MKKIIAPLVAGFFLVVASSAVWAKNYTCVVLQVDGDNITLECKNGEGLAEGMKVKVKTSSKKAIEGC